MNYMYFIRLCTRDVNCELCDQIIVEELINYEETNLEYLDRTSYNQSQLVMYFLGNDTTAVRNRIYTATWN